MTLTQSITALLLAGPLLASPLLAEPLTSKRPSTIFPQVVGAAPILDQNTSKGLVDDSHLSLLSTNQYYDADFRSGTAAQRANASRQSEWGQGFRLNFQSGYTQGSVGLGMDVLGLWAFKLDSGGRIGKGDRQPAIIFPRDTDNSSVNEFGSVHFTPKMRISKTELRYGVHQPKWPILLSSGQNLAPQLFRGWMLSSNEIDNLQINLGRFDANKGRASTDMVPMSIPGSYNNRDVNKRRYSNDFNFFLSEYQVNQNLKLQYQLGQLEDFYNQHFFGINSKFGLGDGLLWSEIRYYRSTGNGENRTSSGRNEGYVGTGYFGNGVTSGEVDNTLYSVLSNYSIGGHTFSLGYQKSQGPSDFPWINQGEGNISGLNADIWINKFQRSGERTVQARYSYDFAAMGIPGLNLGVAYLKGTGINSAEGDLKERVRGGLLSYAIQSGPLKGVGFLYSYASLKTQVNQPSIDEQRFMINYTKAFF